MKRKHQPIRPPEMQHPSGRPVVREKRGTISRTNIPHHEPLTPGLQRGDLQEAIGFTANLISNDEDDEEFDYTREAE